MIGFTALLTTAATANAVLVVTSRISFAMARDGLLPGALATVGARTGTPWVAVVVSATLLAAVATTGSARVGASAGGFLYVLHFVVPLAALVALRRRGGLAAATFRTPAPQLVLPLAFAACAVLLVAGGTDGAAGGLGWLAVGVAGYGAAAKRRGARGCSGSVPCAADKQLALDAADRRHQDARC